MATQEQSAEASIDPPVPVLGSPAQLMPNHLRQRLEARRVGSASRRRTKEELDQALIEAEQRKKTFQMEKMEAIKHCDDRTRHLDDKVQLLIQYDASKRPNDGHQQCSENDQMPQISSRELRQTVRQVEREFRQLSKDLVLNTKIG